MAETQKSTKVFTDEERAAMKQAVAERRTSAKRSPKNAAADGLADVHAAIAKLGDDERAIAEKLHEIVTDVAPQLMPKTWYGFPSYANSDGKVVVFFQPGSKFKGRYSTLGFQDAAQLDDGNIWPSAYAIVKLTKADEKVVADLVKRAAG